MSDKAGVDSTAEDLPSGEPVPMSAPTPPSKPPKAASIQDLVAHAPANTDAFLAHLQRALSTPSGVDSVLLFICYTSKIVSASIRGLTGPMIQRQAERLVALAAALPPSVTVMFAVNPRSGLLPSPSVAALLNFAGRLETLQALISDVRAFSRLWALLGMYFWGKRLALAAMARRASSKAMSAAERLDTVIAWTQLAGCVGFQALENGAYLSSKKLLGWQPTTIRSAYLWSARLWGSYVCIEIFRLLLEASRRSAAAAQTEEEKAAEAEWAAGWRQTMARQMAWFPLTIHWSLEQGMISDLGVGIIASVPGVLGMASLWKKTAE